MRSLTHPGPAAVKAATAGRRARLAAGGRRSRAVVDEAVVYLIADLNGFETLDQNCINNGITSNRRVINRRRLRRGRRRNARLRLRRVQRRRRRGGVGRRRDARRRVDAAVGRRRRRRSVGPGFINLHKLCKNNKIDRTSQNVYIV